MQDNGTPVIEKNQIDNYSSFKSFGENIKDVIFLYVNNKKKKIMYNILVCPEFSKVKIKIRTTNTTDYKHKD